MFSLLSLRQISLAKQQHFRPKRPNEGRETHLIDFAVKHTLWMLDIAAYGKGPSGTMGSASRTFPTGRPLIQS